jgi:hypothetical protein
MSLWLSIKPLVNTFFIIFLALCISSYSSYIAGSSFISLFGSGCCSNISPPDALSILSFCFEPKSIAALLKGLTVVVVGLTFGFIITGGFVVGVVDVDVAVGELVLLCEFAAEPDDAVESPIQIARHCTLFLEVEAAAESDDVDDDGIVSVVISRQRFRGWGSRG